MASFLSRTLQRSRARLADAVGRFIPGRRVSEEDLEALEEALISADVGPETADCILLYAAGRASFVIDKYTLRFGERFGIFRVGMTYEEARSFFMTHLPKNVQLYNGYHAQIVALGNRYCKPKPLCGECPLDKLCKKRSL